jgi:hypothetical protein
VKRIAWQSRLTGHRGGGTAAYPDKQAENEAAEMNRRWPGIIHWTEDAPEDRPRAAPGRGELTPPAAR